MAGPLAAAAIAAAVASVTSLAPAAPSPGPGVRATLPAAPRRLYSIEWQRAFVDGVAMPWRPLEPGGAAVDPVTGIVLAATRDGWLHAVRPDGSLAWEYRTGAAAPGAPVVDGDTVYVGTSEGVLHALALGTGKARWTYEAKEELGTRPVVRDGSVYVMSLQDTLFAVDARTGAWRWHHRREGREGMSIRGAARAVAGAAAVYAAYSDGFVAALEPANGSVIWERLVAPAGDAQVDVDGLALEGGRLYAAAYSGAVLALDAETGKTLWSFAAPGASRIALAGGVVVAATTTAVHGLSAGDGTPLWSAPLGGAPWSDPVFAGKWVLVPSGPGGLRWIEAATGRTLRVFDPGTGVSGSPAVNGARVYVLSNAGTLYGLGVR